MVRPDLRQRLKAAQQARAEARRERRLRTVLRRDGARCEVIGEGGSARWLLDFSSNDYLGLSQNFLVSGAVEDAFPHLGAGSTGSHLVGGHTSAHAALEREVADWLQAERALLFGSGYLANLGVMQALLGRDDVCVQDRLNHASLIDGARLAGCTLRRYPHADAHAALRQLRAVPDGVAMLATDGVFSMDGDIAPLRELALVAKVQQALLYVDDAHGVGVVGPDGRGSLAEHGLPASAALQLATLGKALGGYGALVVGQAELIEHLVQTARPYIYTTALPPAQAAVALTAVRMARRDEWRRRKLKENIARFRANAARFGFEPLPSETPIQALPCGSEAVALAMSEALETQGFRVVAIRPPTVPEGGSRLRITLSVLHSAQDIDALAQALARARDLSATAGA